MSSRSLVISAVIFIFTILLVIGIGRRSEPVVVKTNLENLPMEIAGYRATEDFFEESVYKELNADKHIYRHYRRNNGKQVDLYIGYYGTAKGGRSSHDPYGCLPGAGWGITESRRVGLRSKHFPNEVQVNYLLAQKGDSYETVLHWYQSEGTKVLSTGIQQNVERLLGRLLYNRNDGAFVRISVYTKREGTDEAIQLAESFAANLLDLLPYYWPIEQ